MYITAPYYYSPPLSPPPISHRKLFFYTANFELFSGGHGHLATLVLRADLHFKKILGGKIEENYRITV
jgi:hypothetical protein